MKDARSIFCIVQKLFARPYTVIQGIHVYEAFSLRQQTIACAARELRMNILA